MSAAAIMSLIAAELEDFDGIPFGAYYILAITRLMKQDSGQRIAGNEAARLREIAVQVRIVLKNIDIYSNG